MATRVTYRSRLPTRRGTSGTLIVVPKQTAAKAVATTADQQFALWVKDQHDQLTALKDQEALSKLADGHTEEFLSYAQLRISSAETPAEADYWRGLVTKAQAKIEDDTLGAEVNAGTKSLEDVAAHISERMDALPGGKSNPNWPTYLKQLSDVKNSIAARDFRNEMLTAQQAYINNPDKLQAKKDYAGVLQSMYFRAKDPTAQAEVKKQLDTMTTAIANDEQLARQKDLAVKTTQFENHTLKFGDFMKFLSDAAANATTAAEADHYATLASQAETKQRTWNNEAITAASKNGQTAIDAALFKPKEDYLNAKQLLQNELDKGAPTPETVNAFKTAAQMYDQALRQAAPNATTQTHLEGMLSELRTISNDYSNSTRQAATAVVDDALKKGANYQGLVDAEKAGNEKDSANQAEGVSSARYLWTQSLRDAMNSPLLTGNDKEKARLQSALTAVTNAQRTDIARESGYLSGELQTAGQKKYDALYDAYIQAGGTASIDEWKRGVAKYEGMTADEATAERQRLAQLLRSGDSSVVPAMVHNQMNALTAAQDHASEVFDRSGALAAYVASRTKDGSTTAGPDNLYAQGGLLDESTRARSMAQNGTAGSAGPVVEGRPESLSNGLVPQDPAQRTNAMADETPSTQGNWNRNDFLPNDPNTRLLEAHVAGNNALEIGGQSIPLPQWEIPALPNEPAFMPSDSSWASLTSGLEAPPVSGGSFSFDQSALPPPPFGVSAAPMSEGTASNLAA